MIFYSIFYLFCIYKNSDLELFFLGCRLLMVSYWAFRRFFYIETKKSDSIYIETLFYLPFFPTFLVFYIELQSIEKQVDRVLFSAFSTLIFFCLYKKNSIILVDVKNYEKSCKDELIFLENKKSSLDLQSLYLEKSALMTENSFFFMRLGTFLVGSQKNANFFTPN